MADGEGSEVQVAPPNRRVDGAVFSGVGKPVFVTVADHVYFGTLAGFDTETGLSHVQTADALMMNVPKSVEGSEGWSWVDTETEEA